MFSIRLYGMSIVITGNPGVGKHTIAKEISKILELSIVDINDIAKNAGLFERDNETNDVDTFKLKKIIDKKISGKNLIVGHLAPYVVSKNKVKVIIILRRNPYELLSIYQERKYTNKKSKDNAGSEVLGIIAHDAINKFQEKAFQVNVSGKSIQETTERVRSTIMDKKNNDEVDWLELIIKNQDLKKFFTD